MSRALHSRDAAKWRNAAPRVALAHSRGRLAGLAERLAERGMTVVHSPLLETVPLVSTDVRARLRALEDAAWILFASPAAVEAWHGLGMPLRSDRLRLGAVGAQTAETLERFGALVTLCANPQTADGLVASFVRHPEAKGPVGLPRGNRSRPDLQRGLEEAGFSCIPVVVYRTLTRQWRGGEADIVVLASPSAVEALPDSVVRSARLVAIGPTTTQAIEQLGVQAVTASTPNAEGVLKAVEEAAKLWRL